MGEKQLDLPALTVQADNELWLRGEVVGQNRDALARFALDHETTQSRRIVLAEIEHREHADLIADDGGLAAVHGVGVAPPELGVALGAR